VPVASRIYFPLFQRSNNALTVYYRSSTDPAALGTDVESAIQRIDPTLPVFGRSTMESLLADSMVRRKVVLALMATFAIVALLLAAIGTYGVMNVAASERVREIGIRMALGAQRRDIERLMVRPGLTLATAGVAVGVLGAAFLTPLMSAVLFAVTPTDAGDVCRGVAAPDRCRAGCLLCACTSGHEARSTGRAADGLVRIAG
jgi:ABC-type antimicrobial peptide transport system permease subunit